MSLLVNLVSSSDGNDIGVGLTYVVISIPMSPFYLEQIFSPSLVCILFLTVIATCNTFQQYWNNISDNCNTCLVITNPERVVIVFAMVILYRHFSRYQYLTFCFRYEPLIWKQCLVSSIDDVYKFWCESVCLGGRYDSQ